MVKFDMGLLPSSISLSNAKHHDHTSTLVKQIVKLLFGQVIQLLAELLLLIDDF